MATSQIAGLSVSQLLEKSPDEVWTWFQEVREGLRTVPEDFNWHGLAECAGQNAQKATSDDLTWAQVAVAVYEWLAREKGADSFVLSAMLIRARTIGLFGPRSGDLVLDPVRLRDWFFKDLSWSPAEAAARSNHCQGKPNFHDLRTLRQIKNKLAVIEQLCEQNPLLASPEYKAWLALQENLP